jgi:hypothetical protein
MVSNAHIVNPVTARCWKNCLPVKWGQHVCHHDEQSPVEEVDVAMKTGTIFRSAAAQVKTASFNQSQPYATLRVNLQV